MIILTDTILEITAQIFLMSCCVGLDLPKIGQIWRNQMHDKNKRLNSLTFSWGAEIKFFFSLSSAEKMTAAAQTQLSAIIFNLLWQWQYLNFISYRNSFKTIWRTKQCLLLKLSFLRNHPVKSIIVSAKYFWQTLFAIFRVLAKEKNV